MFPFTGGDKALMMINGSSGGEKVRGLLLLHLQGANVKGNGLELKQTWPCLSSAALFQLLSADGHIFNHPNSFELKKAFK